MCRGELSCEIDVNVEDDPLVDGPLGWSGVVLPLGLSGNPRGKAPLLGWRGFSWLKVRTAKRPPPILLRPA